jgi:putative hemolysin
MDVKTQIVILAVMILLSGFFSALETAFYSIGHITIRSLLRQKHPSAPALHRIKHRQRRMIITVLVMNNLVNIGASAFAAGIAIKIYGSTGIGIATAVMTFLILVFGEIVPKNLAALFAERMALFLARPLEILMWALLPITYIFEVMIMGLNKLVNVRTQKIFSEEKLKTLVEIGTEEKSLGMSERELIEGVLDFDDITAQEVMTPRVQVFALNKDLKIKDALPIINKENFSRIPIYKGSIDQVVGFVHIKEILMMVEKKKLNLRLEAIARKPLFTSQERIVSELFKELQGKRTHLAVVVDEHGGTEGILTIEDLLEELVGEIMDETDLSPEMIMRIDKNTIVVHGDTEIDDINRFFNVELPRKRKYHTIAGLMHYELHKIPRKNSTIEISGLKVKVLVEVGNKPIKIRISKSTSTSCNQSK